MYDFESLVGELLQSRPDLDREGLMKRIEEKKRTVGAGYLTDQGALFLVAGELGVSLRKEEASSDLSIKDLYIGANDVTVVARVLSVYPEASYNKKDGGTGKYRRFVLFDGPQAVRLTVWEEKAEEVGRALPEVGAPVRVVSGYVKQGLDGKPTLNLGKRGRIEEVSDQKVVGRLKSLDAVTEKLGKLSEERQFVAVEGVVTSEPRYSEFTRSDGSGGSLFHFGVAGSGGKGEVRVVVWSPTERPELKPGQKVVVTNVRARRSNTGDFEIHGDAGSSIVLGAKAEKIELRIAASGLREGAKTVLGVGKDGKVREVELGKEVDEPAVGDVVRVSPDSEVGGRLYCGSKGSLKVVEGDGFPSIEDLVTKLKEAKVEDSRIVAEVIALSHGTVDDVRLRDGTTVKKGELVVGDDTSEIKLVAWRELSERLSGIQPGERVRVVGVVVKSTNQGVRVLEVSNATSIERLRGRA
jgi:hypothetical protein